MFYEKGIERQAEENREEIKWQRAEEKKEWRKGKMEGRGR